jgi:hypothetical protein
VWAYNIEVTAINHFIGSGPFARALRYWAHYHISPAAAALCDKDDQGRCLARGFKLSELVRGARTSSAARVVQCGDGRPSALQQGCRTMTWSQLF